MSNGRDIEAFSEGAFGSSDGAYHLVFTFLTESNPTGGWWFESSLQEGEPGLQTTESEWLDQTLHWYNEIAEKAISARVFGICCGINLAASHVVDDIICGFDK